VVDIAVQGLLQTDTAFAMFFTPSVRLEALCRDGEPPYWNSTNWLQSFSGLRSKQPERPLRREIASKMANAFRQAAEMASRAEAAINRRYHRSEIQSLKAWETGLWN